MTNTTEMACSGAALTERDWRFLADLRSLLDDGAGRERIATRIGEYERAAQNGLVADIKLDAQGLFGLFISRTTKLSLRPDLAHASESDLRAALVARIDAIRPDAFTLPPALHRCETSAIDFEGRLIAVRQLASKPWDYIVCVGVDEPAVYVDILKGSIALYSTVRRLSEEDAAVVHDLAPHALDRLVDKYR